MQVVDLAQLHSSILEDLSPDDALRLKKSVGDLLTHQGWIILAQYLNVFYRSKIASIAAAPIKSLDEALPQEFEKGTASAILLLLQLPEQLTLLADNTLQMGAREAQEAQDEADGWSTERI